MQEVKSIIDIVKDIGGLGLLALAVVLAARYFVPKLDKWFEKHFGLVDTLQEKLNKSDTVAATNDEQHAKTHHALIIIAPEDKKIDVERVVKR